jgi:hemerythrin-like domain-containing protein
VGLSVEDLHGLCPIHLELLGEQLEQMRSALPKGHVVSTLVHEHDAILGFLDMLDQVNETIQGMSGYPGQTREFHNSAVAEHLVETERHHQQEEDVLFPSRTAGHVRTPMMREEHKQLRPRKRELKKLVETVDRQDFADFKRRLNELAGFIVPTLREHIYKENNILYPAALQVIDDDRVWQKLKAECDSIGYCCFTPEA